MESRTHGVMLATGTFLTCRHVATDLGNNSVGVRDIALKFRNDSVGIHNVLMNVGNDGMGVHDIMANVRNDNMCVYCKFGLERTVGNGQTEVTERTLKT